MAIVVQEAPLDANELMQTEDVRIPECLVLDSGENTVPQVELLLHQTTLAIEGTVGLGQGHHRQLTCGCRCI